MASRVSNRLVVICLICCVVATVPVVAEDVQLLRAVYPNTVTPFNAGEFVVLDPPVNETLAGWTLSDGTHTARLPPVNEHEPIALSTDPAITSLLTDLPVYGLEGHLPLATDGDELVLRNDDGVTIDQFKYGHTGTGEHWLTTPDRPVREPRYATAWSTEFHHDVEATLFLLPDSPDVPIETLHDADDRIYLAGYELTDPNVVDALIAAASGGVTVEIVVDGTPVGGQSGSEYRALDTLVSAGVDVRVRTGARDPYRFHHPKYAVVDDTAIVMTENWKRAGTGGAASRGWGIRIRDESISRELASVFTRDVTGPATISWTLHRADDPPTADPPPAQTFPQQHAPLHVTGTDVQLVVGPEETGSVLLEVIADAKDSIRVQQVSIADMSFPLLDALIQAAERGVNVRILLDSSWYVREQNAAIAEDLTELASREDLPVATRLVEPDGRFEKIHTKGFIVDEQQVFLGSTNWNNVSLGDNRELGVLIDHPAAGSYLVNSFDSDWRGAAWTVPIGFALSALLAWTVTGLLARRTLRFDPKEKE